MLGVPKYPTPNCPLLKKVIKYIPGRENLLNIQTIIVLTVISNKLLALLDSLENLLLKNRNSMIQDITN